MEFQENIKQWVSKDNQIRTYSGRIKSLRQERNNLTEQITVGLGQMNSRSVSVDGNSSGLKIRSDARIS